MNTLTILNMLREKGIAAVRTPAGIRFMGCSASKRTGQGDDESHYAN